MNDLIRKIRVRALQLALTVVVLLTAGVAAPVAPVHDSAVVGHELNGVQLRLRIKNAELAADDRDGISLVLLARYTGRPPTDPRL